MKVGNSTSSGVGVTVGNDWAEVTMRAEEVGVRAGGLVVPTQAINIIVTVPAKINAPWELMSNYLLAQLIRSDPN